jgi:hypothetical protein
MYLFFITSVLHKLKTPQYARLYVGRPTNKNNIYTGPRRTVFAKTAQCSQAKLFLRKETSNKYYMYRGPLEDILFVKQTNRNFDSI